MFTLYFYILYFIFNNKKCMFLFYKKLAELLKTIHVQLPF